MRGKRAPIPIIKNEIGITPAHAGKTESESDNNEDSRDHPRACGENGHTAMSAPVSGGSPPRMRGKHFGNGVFPWLILVLSLNPL